MTGVGGKVQGSDSESSVSLSSERFVFSKEKEGKTYKAFEIESFQFSSKFKGGKMAPDTFLSRGRHINIQYQKHPKL